MEDAEPMTLVVLQTPAKFLSLLGTRERYSGLLQWLAPKARQPFFLRLVPSSTHPTNRNVTGLSQGLALECWCLSSLLSIPVIHFLSVHFWGKVVTSIASPALQSVFQLSSGTACPQAGKLGWARVFWLRHHIPGKRWLPGFLFCPSRCREQHLLLWWITIRMLNWKGKLKQGW